MEDLKLEKQKNNIGVLIFVILICLLFVHAKKTRNALSVFCMTLGIAVYTFSQVYIYSTTDKVTPNMVLAQIIFNAVILFVIILLTLSPPNKDNFELDPTDKIKPSVDTVDVMNPSVDTVDMMKPSVDTVDENKSCASSKPFESRQIFEVSPIKKCCGGPYMRTSKPGMDKFCSQFSAEELINKCVARKNEYAVPIQPGEQDQVPCDKGCPTCRTKRPVGSMLSIIGVS